MRGEDCNGWWNLQVDVGVLRSLVWFFYQPVLREKAAPRTSDGNGNDECRPTPDPGWTVGFELACVGGCDVGNGRLTLTYRFRWCSCFLSACLVPVHPKEQHIRRRMHLRCTTG